MNSYRRKALKVESNIHGEIDDSKIQEMSAMLVKGFNKMKLRRAQTQGNFQKRSLDAHKQNGTRRKTLVMKRRVI